MKANQQKAESTLIVKLNLNADQTKLLINAICDQLKEFFSTVHETVYNYNVENFIVTIGQDKETLKFSLELLQENGVNYTCTHRNIYSGDIITDETQIKSGLTSLQVEISHSLMKLRNTLSNYVHSLYDTVDFANV